MTGEYFIDEIGWPRCSQCGKGYTISVGPPKPNCRCLKVALPTAGLAATIAGQLIASWWGERERAKDNPSQQMMRERALGFAFDLIADAEQAVRDRARRQAPAPTQSDNALSSSHTPDDE